MKKKILKKLMMLAIVLATSSAQAKSVKAFSDFGGGGFSDFGGGFSDFSSSSSDFSSSSSFDSFSPSASDYSPISSSGSSDFSSSGGSDSFTPSASDYVPIESPSISAPEPVSTPSASDYVPIEPASVSAPEPVSTPSASEYVPVEPASVSAPEPVSTPSASDYVPVEPASVSAPEPVSTPSASDYVPVEPASVSAPEPVSTPSASDYVPVEPASVSAPEPVSTPSASDYVPIEPASVSAPEPVSTPSASDYVPVEPASVSAPEPVSTPSASTSATFSLFDEAPKVEDQASVADESTFGLGTDTDLSLYGQPSENFGDSLEPGATTTSDEGSDSVTSEKAEELTSDGTTVFTPLIEGESVVDDTTLYDSISSETSTDTLSNDEDTLFTPGTTDGLVNEDIVLYTPVDTTPSTATLSGGDDIVLYSPVDGATNQTYTNGDIVLYSPINQDSSTDTLSSDGFVLYSPISSETSTATLSGGDDTVLYSPVDGTANQTYTSDDIVLYSPIDSETSTGTLSDDEATFYTPELGPQWTTDDGRPALIDIPRTVTVKKGDSLDSIGRRIYPDNPEYAAAASVAVLQQLTEQGDARRSNKANRYILDEGGQATVDLSQATPEQIDTLASAYKQYVSSERREDNRRIAVAEAEARRQAAIRAWQREQRRIAEQQRQVAAQQQAIVAETKDGVPYLRRNNSNSSASNSLFGASSGYSLPAPKIPEGYKLVNIANIEKQKETPFMKRIKEALEVGTAYAAKKFGTPDVMKELNEYTNQSRLVPDKNIKTVEQAQHAVMSSGSPIGMPSLGHFRLTPKDVKYGMVAGGKILEKNIEVIPVLGSLMKRTGTIPSDLYTLFTGNDFYTGEKNKYRNSPLTEQGARVGKILDNALSANSGGYSMEDYFALKYGVDIWTGKRLTEAERKAAGLSIIGSAESRRGKNDVDRAVKLIKQTFGSGNLPPSNVLDSSTSQEANPVINRKE